MIGHQTLSLFVFLPTQAIAILEQQGWDGLREVLPGILKHLFLSMHHLCAEVVLRSVIARQMRDRLASLAASLVSQSMVVRHIIIVGYLLSDDLAFFSCLEVARAAWSQSLHEGCIVWAVHHAIVVSSVLQICKQIGLAGLQHLTRDYWGFGWSRFWI